MLGTNVPNYIDAPDASRRIRLAAAIIDESLMIGIPALMGLYAFWLGGEPYPMSWVSTVWFMVMVLSQTMLLTFYGQSIGKIIFGTVIVLTSTGENGGFIPNVLLRNTLSRFLSAIPFYLLIDHFLIFSKSRRCVHDWIADTRVVQIKSPHYGFAQFLNVGCICIAVVVLVGVSPTGLGGSLRQTLSKGRLSVLTGRLERLVFKARLKDGFEHPNVAIPLIQLGDLHLRRRQFNKAVAAWDEGMRLAADGGGLYQQSAIYSARAIGHLYLVLQDYETSQRYLEYALSLIANPAQLNPRFASSESRIGPTVITNGSVGAYPYANPVVVHSSASALMGRLMAETNNWQAAESYFSDALKLLERSLSIEKDDALFIDSLVGLAGVYIKELRFADARALIERAEKISQELDPMRWGRAEVLKVQAEYYEAINDYDLAIKYAIQAVEIVMQGDPASVSPDARRFVDTINRIEMRR